MKKLILCAGFCALPLLIAASPNTTQDGDQTTPVTDKAKTTKAQKVRRLLKLTSGDKMGQQAVAMMVKQFERMPNLPVGYVAKFKEMVKPDELVELIIPVYTKNVAEKDLDGIIEFFKSDVGKNWLVAQKKILSESQAINEKWGRGWAQKVMNELRK